MKRINDQVQQGREVWAEFSHIIEKNGEWLNGVIIGDESGIFHYNPEREMQSMH
jgi:hypothetical protein